MPSRLRTEVPGFDTLLGGGLLRDALHLIAGDPGSGKTVLAHQMASAAAREGRVLYLTALVELHETLQKQAANFEFFDPSAVGRSLYYASVFPAFSERGFAGARELILSLLQEHDPVLLILDGLHVLKEGAESSAEYNRFLGGLQAQACSTGTTLVVISNLDPGKSADGAFAIPDGVILLETEPRNAQRVRRLEVRKLRTSRVVAGSHALEVTKRGVEVFPRLEAVMANAGPQREPGENAERVLPLGVEGLDRMLYGGVPGASATLVAGAAGAGKTSLALSFLARGLEDGEPGVFLGFHESPDRVAAKGRGLGCGIEGAEGGAGVPILWHSASEIPADRMAYRLLEAVDEVGASRVAIDGMDNLLEPLLVEGRGGGFINALLNLLRARGVGVLLTMELADVFSLEVALPTSGISTSMDNILVLRGLEARSELRHLVSLLKVRDHGVDPSLRDFRITPQGIQVGARFATSDRLVREDDAPGTSDAPAGEESWGS